METLGNNQDHEPIADVIYMTDIIKDSMKKRRETLDPERKEYYITQAAYWGGVEEDAQRQVDYAAGQREYALQMLGMLPEHGGYPA